MSRDVGYLPRRAGGEPRRVLVAGRRESESDRTGEGQEGLVDAENRLELAMAVTDRIAQLHLTRRELEKKSGVSVATIREIEHPKGPRNFGRKVLEAISEALDWPPGHLVRVAYRPPSETPDPTVQAMMTALAPYLEKIDAIPQLQADVAAIKADLGIAVDPIHEVSDSVEIDRRPRQGSDEHRDAHGPA
jgi:transcriptional regulator with XRE-family HTH domain